MNRERRILNRYQDKVYVPHSWDNWVKEKVKPKTVKPRAASVVVRTVMGELAKVCTERLTQGDWGTKSLTSDCEECPFYVIASQARTLGSLDGLIDINTRGLCLFSETKEGRVIPKILVPTRLYKKKCTIPVRIRDQRIELRRTG